MYMLFSVRKRLATHHAQYEETKYGDCQSYSLLFAHAVPLIKTTAAAQLLE